ARMRRRRVRESRRRAGRPHRGRAPRSGAAALESMAGGELAGDDAYLQGAPCPKCGYARRPADANPAWQCPQCLVAYRKGERKVRQAAQPVARLVAGTREVAADSASDRSVYSLIAANLFAIGVGVATGMSLRDLMLVYWAQSVAIGIAYFIRILALDRFTV